MRILNCMVFGGGTHMRGDWITNLGVKGWEATGKATVRRGVYIAIDPSCCTLGHPFHLQARVNGGSFCEAKNYHIRKDRGGESRGGENPCRPQI